jgi:hypothetical protein
MAKVVEIATGQPPNDELRYDMALVLATGMLFANVNNMSRCPAA